MDDFIIYKIYQELNGIGLSDALTAFDNLKDDELLGDYNVANKYFQTFGVGNPPHVPDKPFERFKCYEFLLHLLQQRNLERFNSMHKGTPYYFLSWTAFDMGDCERGLFYLDAAIAEDKRIKELKWTESPPGIMLTLNAGGTAWRVETRLKDSIYKAMDAFKTTFSFSFDKKLFVSKFVIPLIDKEDKKNRSIITSLYSFVLEFLYKNKMLLLRSSEGGTIEPFLLHLSKGAIVFETLIKEVANKNSWKMDSGDKKGQSPKTLGNFNYCQAFTSKYCNLKISQEITNLKEILDLSFQNEPEKAVNTVYLLRNQLMHDLRWDDIFNNISNYKEFFDRILNAILLVVYKEYIE